MDVVGSEIGQKMRSAIKAKLTELGCYVDDELPDYVMVMVANKRTRGQMEDDLQLFLGDNTELFVNWLHQVLKKLQEVTVTAPLKTAEQEKSKERSSSKERKSKDKKDKEKTKKSDLKKAKKKEKEKLHRKKEEKKEKKSKKKSKHHDMIRPNIPPLLMNMEKESEPSITDVFAGQILKSHGISMESLKEDKVLVNVEQKVIVKEHKRPIVPIIDPATISSQPDPDVVSLNSENTIDSQEKITKASVSSQETVKEDQIKEINEIEAKIQGLKQKLAEQLDSMSEDEDFLNIRTEAEELMNDFAEDVLQEISQQAPVNTPPLEKRKSPSPPKEITPKPVEVPKPVETLPQIELNLPKRPVRERLGAREEQRKTAVVERRTEQKADSQERFTPEPLPEFITKTKSAKSRLSDPPERSGDFSDDSDKPEPSIKRLTSKVSVLESRARCASVVRVRPRPRVSTPASSLLMRAVADAHKSLLTTPPKVDTEPPKVKRGIVLPMRRVGDPNIVVQVPGERAADSQDDNISLEMDSDEEKRVFSDLDRDEYVPKSLTMQIKNTDYVPSKRNEVRTASRRDDTLVIETINIHNPTVDKDKNTQFIVTMDGFNPNAFLAKKLMTEGLLNDDDEETEKTKDTSNKEKYTPTKADKAEPQESAIKEKSPKTSPPKSKEVKTIEKDTPQKSIEEPKESPKKRLSSESTESNTQVVIKQDKLKESKSKEDNSKTLKASEKRKSDTQPLKIEEKSPPVKKRRTPIVFDVDKKEKEVVKERVRTESASSDNNVVLTSGSSSHKYDALPPLSTTERKPVWCRAFPLCRYGSACAFQHPRCKFAAACTRRGCVYAHATPPAAAPAPTISSHVVPVANYKSITTAPTPGMCKYYPSCSNPTCGFFHPKACRYGAACLNKLECNFYHADLPPSHWRHPA